MRKDHRSLGKSQEQVQVFISSSQGVCLSHMPFTVLFKQFVLRLISSSHSPLASTCYRPGNFQPRKQKVPFFFFFIQVEKALSATQSYYTRLRREVSSNGVAKRMALWLGLLENKWSSCAINYLISGSNSQRPRERGWHKGARFVAALHLYFFPERSI